MVERLAERQNGRTHGNAAAPHRAGATTPVANLEFIDAPRPEVAFGPGSLSRHLPCHQLRPPQEASPEGSQTLWSRYWMARLTVRGLRMPPTSSTTGTRPGARSPGTRTFN